MKRTVPGGHLAAILAGALGLALVVVATIQWNFHPGPRTAWTIGLAGVLAALSVASALSLAGHPRRTFALSPAALLVTVAVVMANAPDIQSPIDGLALALGVLALALALAAWRSAKPAPAVP